jgi:hypothetical protein
MKKALYYTKIQTILNLYTFKDEEKPNMSYLSKPVVVVSKCIGFASCRYNGQYINSGFC